MCSIRLTPFDFARLFTARIPCRHTSWNYLGPVAFIAAYPVCDRGRIVAVASKRFATQAACLCRFVIYASIIRSFSVRFASDAFIIFCSENSQVQLICSHQSLRPKIPAMRNSTTIKAIGAQNGQSTQSQDQYATGSTSRTFNTMNTIPTTVRHPIPLDVDELDDIFFSFTFRLYKALS